MTLKQVNPSIYKTEIKCTNHNFVSFATSVSYTTLNWKRKEEIMGDKKKIDPELFNTFVEDTLEEINQVEGYLIKLEKKPDDHELINAIMRPIHSTKGNCSFFGLQKGKELAHVYEDVLNCALKNKNVITSDLISTFIKTIDLIKRLLSNVQDNKDELDGISQKYNQALEVLVEARDRARDENFNPHAILEKLELIESELQGVSEKHAKDLTEVIGILLRAESNEAKNAGVHSQINELIQDMRNIFTAAMECALEEEQSELVGEKLKSLKELTDNTPAEEIINEAIEQYVNITASVGFEPFLAEIIEEQFVKLEQIIDEIPDQPAADAEDEEPKSDEEREDEYDFTSIERFELTQDEINDLLVKRYSQSEDDDDEEDLEEEHRESKRSMRVSEESIDNFLDSVGNLIVVREMYNNLSRKITKDSDIIEFQNHFKRINATFFQLSEKLNDAIMEIRKVSVAGLTQKVPRIVRDVAETKNKIINVELEGENTLIDKRLIEVLDAPLIHITRNAADHGIESPEARLAAGKTEGGNIKVSFGLRGDDVEVIIKDDGNGLNFDAIRNKAIEMDLLDPNITLSEEDQKNLLFLPGLTTSQNVTEISGRGVGMDVVKKNIEEAGGKIKIETKQGEGTQFTIILPQAVMTQIINGYVIRIENNQYILPMEEVHEVFCIPGDKITTVTDKGMCVKRRNQLLSIIRPFSPYDYQYSSSELIPLVALHCRGQLVALHIDEAVGVQRVVLNKVKGLTVASEIFTASAIMGDGRISMVINPTHIWESKVN